MILHCVKTQKTKVWKLIFFLSICLPANMSVYLSVCQYIHILQFSNSTLITDSATFHHTHLSVNCFHSGHSFDQAHSHSALFAGWFASPLQILNNLECQWVASVPLTCPKREGLPVAMLLPLCKIGGPTSSFATATVQNGRAYQ